MKVFKFLLFLLLTSSPAFAILNFHMMSSTANPTCACVWNDSNGFHIEMITCNSCRSDGDVASFKKDCDNFVLIRDLPQKKVKNFSSDNEME